MGVNFSIHHGTGTGQEKKVNRGRWDREYVDCGLKGAGRDRDLVFLSLMGLGWVRSEKPLSCHPLVQNKE